MNATPPSETPSGTAVPATKTLLSGVVLGFLLALFVGSALYWWANRPVPAALTLEAPAAEVLPISTQAAQPEPAQAAEPVATLLPSRSVGIQAVSGVLLNLNTASLAELETLPGIGPTRAQAIVAGRPYAAVDDLEKVSGIGPVTLEELRPLVTTE